MLTTINPALGRRRIAPLLGVVGVVSLLAVALPELSTAGEAVFAAAASPATVKIDNFAFAPATLTISVCPTGQARGLKAHASAWPTRSSPAPRAGPYASSS
jgi:hypothetical protein